MKSTDGWFTNKCIDGINKFENTLIGLKNQKLNGGINNINNCQNSIENYNLLMEKQQ